MGYVDKARFIIEPPGLEETSDSLGIWYGGWRVSGTGAAYFDILSNLRIMVPRPALVSELRVPFLRIPLTRSSVSVVAAQQEQYEVLPRLDLAILGRCLIIYPGSRSLFDRSKTWESFTSPLGVRSEKRGVLSRTILAISKK